MIHKSTLSLLRIPFSFLLLPVYLFALSQAPQIEMGKALGVFFILHLLVYPSSNGYNSFMDRDQESIGMLKHPPMPSRQLFWISVILDGVAFICSAFINVYFLIGVSLNILASRAYSYRGIRLKKYPLWGFLTVIFFQGAWTYWMVSAGVSPGPLTRIPWLAMVASSLLFGCFYPLTQIYQHRQDLADGVQSISYRLGYLGTFGLSAVMFLLADGIIFEYFRMRNQPFHFILLQLFLAPVMGYFFYWFNLVRKDPAQANFRHTMRMNLLGALSTNIYFFTLLILNHF
ncbi:MAG: UbiA family prenyltransferase [Chitinophagaceae bacterium]